MSRLKFWFVSNPRYTLLWRWQGPSSSQIICGLSTSKPFIRRIRRWKSVPRQKSPPPEIIIRLKSPHIMTYNWFHRLNSGRFLIFFIFFQFLRENHKNDNKAEFPGFYVLILDIISMIRFLQFSCKESFQKI